MRYDKVNPRGFPVPMLVRLEKCNACAVCGWMCPDSAIEVYRWVEQESSG